MFQAVFLYINVLSCGRTPRKGHEHSCNGNSCHPWTHTGIRTRCLEETAQVLCCEQCPSTLFPTMVNCFSLGTLTCRYGRSTHCWLAAVHQVYLTISSCSVTWRCLPQCLHYFSRVLDPTDSHAQCTAALGWTTAWRDWPRTTASPLVHMRHLWVGFTRLPSGTPEGLLVIPSSAVVDTWSMAPLSYGYVSNSHRILTRANVCLSAFPAPAPWVLMFSFCQ